ncbi:MAG: FKBP-type peptidyl-prolyl cis-trans isomerase [Chitinophagaceae bacterium]|nr:FKBP-type peptidyl-prolyl cis-trans isomerase [Chitinophagaceae bacterium]
MKKIVHSLLFLAATIFFVACSNVDYRKSKSGLLYKIFPSSGTDSLAVEGDWVKLHFVQRVNDSVVQSTFGKMPIYARASNGPDAHYSPIELLSKLKKGDSVVVVLYVDSMYRKGVIQQLPPTLKLTDRIIYDFKILEVFRDDSLFRADEARERELDAPRMQKEKEEQMEKMRAEMMEKRKAEEEEMEKSGEAAKGIKAMEDYLASKNITNAKMFGKGTFVVVNNEGTGEQVAPGKFVEVEYVGSLVRNDSIFDRGLLEKKLGRGELISGMEEGLEAFKAGGSGTLFIPGFRAYGKSHPRFQPFEPMKFDVKVLRVSDTLSAPRQ